MSVMDRTLPFLSLQVISCLRLTDHGLVGVVRFYLVLPYLAALDQEGER
jgi:adenine deaminase